MKSLTKLVMALTGSYPAVYATLRVRKAKIDDLIYSITIITIPVLMLIDFIPPL